MKDRKYLIAPSILAILLVAALVWGYNQYQTKKQREIALENYYQSLFFDIKKHIENIQVNLSKVMVANTKERNILLLSQISNEAISAHTKLGQMPLTHAEIANTEKFLNQAADYSTYLIQKHLQGEELTEEQRQALSNIQNNSVKFNEELTNIQNSLAEGNFFLGSLTASARNRVKEANENILQTSLVQLDEQFAKTPELIYDGPFADQMINRKPVGLPENEVTAEEARKIAAEFLGNVNIINIEQFEEGEHINEARIPAYTFNVYVDKQRNSPIYMGVSKKGGKVVWMNNPRPVGTTKLSVKNAEERALKFLQEKGFENMEPNYYLKYDGTILFNFVNTENKVTIYPDLVKVKVALDTGEIVGFDASAYYLNHHDRKIDEPHLTEAEARSKVRQDFNIDSIRLAIIPKGKNEVLCYEFKGKYNGSDFIVYINALDGSEEEILQLIKNENGTLTF
ncbi:MAG TPA: germination protein YpeB [Tissierellaceae bacterium]